MFQKLPGVDSLPSLDLTYGFEKKCLFLGRKLECVAVTVGRQDGNFRSVGQRFPFHDDLSIDDFTGDHLHELIIAWLKIDDEGLRLGEHASSSELPSPSTTQQVVSHQVLVDSIREDAVRSGVGMVVDGEDPIIGEIRVTERGTHVQEMLDAACRG